MARSKNLNFALELESPKLLKMAEDENKLLGKSIPAEESTFACLVCSNVYRVSNLNYFPRTQHFAPGKSVTSVTKKV